MIRVLSSAFASTAIDTHRRSGDVEQGIVSHPVYYIVAWDALGPDI